jgi:hypothetical protein
MAYIYLLDVKVPSPGDMISETATNQWSKYAGNCKYGIDDTVIDLMLNKHV